MNQSTYQVHRHNDARTDTSPSSGLDLGTPAWHPCTLHLSSQHANSTGFAGPRERISTRGGQGGSGCFAGISLRRRAAGRRHLARRRPVGGSGGLGATPLPSSGDVVLVSGPLGVSVGISDAGEPGLCGERGVLWDSRSQAGWSLYSRGGSLAVTPTVSPLTHSKLVIRLIGSRKTPSAATTTAPQRSVANRRERFPGCEPWSVLSVSCTSLSGAFAAAAGSAGPSRPFGNSAMAG